MSTRTKTKPEKPTALTVEDATRARDDATKRLDDLTKKLTNGDTDVTADDLNDARTAAEHAELVLRGARNRAHRETEERFKADLEAFTKAWPKRLAKKRDKIAPAHAEAVDKLDKLHSIAADAERTREGIRAEWEMMRPEDVPPDANDLLPEHYKQAKPKDRPQDGLDLTVPNPAAAVLSAAVETIKKAGVHRLDGDLIRVIEKHCNGVKYSNRTPAPKE